MSVLKDVREVHVEVAHLSRKNSYIDVGVKLTYLPKRKVFRCPHRFLLHPYPPLQGGIFLKRGKHKIDLFLVTKQGGRHFTEGSGCFPGIFGTIRKTKA